jgi:elongation factor P
MAMLEYSEIKERKYIVFENEPYEVIDSHVFRKQQRKPVNAVKMRNMLTGRIVEHSFHVSDKAEEADISKRSVKYLYMNKNEYWFCDEKDPSNRFPLPESLVGSAGKYLKTNTVVDALIYDDDSEEGKIIGLKLPIKVELKVTEAHPAVKGDTAQGGSKIVKVETGADVQVPMFVKEGDVIRINTDTGDYTDRVTN